MYPKPPANVSELLLTASQETPCETCQARHSCLPKAVDAFAVQSRPFSRRLRIPRGALLYSAGSLVTEYVYMVRYGNFKHTRTDRRGSQMIVGFPGSGDFLALEAIGLPAYDGSVVALDDSEVCEISYECMRQQAQFFQGVLSHSIREVQKILLMQRRGTAEQRLAGFLLERAAWHVARGRSGLRYHLPMSRQEIAAFLNLTPECLSRLLRQFTEHGYISAHGRDVALLDTTALEAVTCQQSQTRGSNAPL